MKDLQKLLEGVADGLKSLSKGIDDVAGKLDALVKAQATGAKKAAPKPAKKATKPAKKKTVTAADTVFAIIKRSKKGIGIAGIKKKTDFNDKKIHNIIYKLKKQEKIQSISKGVYKKK